MDHMFDLAISKFRKYWQTYTRIANTFGYRHRTAPVAQAGVGRLQVQRHKAMLGWKNPAYL